MLGLKKLPVGFESFQEIRKLGCYYVDKTKLIERLLENWSKVNLFTRPRRFGKTLNMSMLSEYYDAAEHWNNHYRYYTFYRDFTIKSTNPVYLPIFMRND